jgi:DnaJ-class molecular chaperone
MSLVDMCPHCWGSGLVGEPLMECPKCDGQGMLFIEKINQGCRKLKDDKYQYNVNKFKNARASWKERASCSYGT